MSTPYPAQVIREEIVRMVAARSADKTVCPSEVARSLAGSNEKEWRKLMQPIRREAAQLANEGRLVMKRKGRTVDPGDFKGIYRLAAASSGS